MPVVRSGSGFAGSTGASGALASTVASGEDGVSSRLSTRRKRLIGTPKGCRCRGASLAREDRGRHPARIPAPPREIAMASQCAGRSRAAPARYAPGTSAPPPRHKEGSDAARSRTRAEPRRGSAGHRQEGRRRASGTRPQAPTRRPTPTSRPTPRRSTRSPAPDDLAGRCGGRRQPAVRGRAQVQPELGQPFGEWREAEVPAEAARRDARGDPADEHHAAGVARPDLDP